MAEETRRDEPVLGSERRGEAIVVHLGGELDLYNAPTVRSALLDACTQQPERLIVDLADVRFVDSTVLGVLVETRTKLEHRRAFLLASAGLETQRALEISGLDRHLALYASVDAALAANLS
jgi:anti-sigma B factor antagonist